VQSSFTVLSAYVLGQPELIGDTKKGQHQTLSCFLKQPANTNGGLFIGHGGIAGDFHADQRPIGSEGSPVHGGPKKAFYFFPIEHYADWYDYTGECFLHGEFNHSQGLGAPANPYAPITPDRAHFGENLRTLGITEQKVRVGDVWQWENATLRVTGPRRPCGKLGMVRGPEAPGWMRNTGHCGWYMELLDGPGAVSVSGQLELVEVGSGPTIADAFRAKMQREPEIPPALMVQ